MKVKRIVGASAIAKAINGVIKSATNAQVKIHEVAVSALAHAEEHGDVTLIAKLVYGLPKGTRANLVSKWARAFAPIKFSDRDMNAKMDKSATAIAFDVDGSEATPFWEMKSEVKPAEITLQAIVDYLSKRAKGKDNDSMETTEQRKLIGKVAHYAAVLASPISGDTAATIESAVNAAPVAVAA